MNETQTDRLLAALERLTDAIEDANALAEGESDEEGAERLLARMQAKHGPKSPTAEMN